MRKIRITIVLLTETQIKLGQYVTGSMDGLATD